MMKSRGEVVQPVVLGGQGRSASEVVDSATGLLFIAAFAALVVTAVIACA